MLTAVETVDEVLADHATALGGDHTAYRNHVYRVLNFAALLARPGPEALEKLAVAAVFHDLGIWTDGTFDYLPPSIRLAEVYLARTGRSAWAPEIAAIVGEHHKVRPYLGDASGLTESFRRADWIDVTFGVRCFGLPRSALAPIFAAWPNAGFHRRLVQLSLARLRTHPRSPLPMVRW